MRRGRRRRWWRTASAVIRYSCYLVRRASFNHISSFIVFSISTIVWQKLNVARVHRTEDKKVYITVWSIFPLWFVHCFDSNTKFYSTCRYSSRHMHTTHNRERIEFIYEFMEWNDEHNAHNGFSFLPLADEPATAPLLGPATWQHAHCMTGIKLQTYSVHKRSPIYGYVKPPRAKDSKRLGSIFVLLCEKMHGTTGKLLFHIFDRNYQLDFHPFLTLPSWWHGGISKTAHHLK